jgi:hypothetical protein
MSSVWGALKRLAGLFSRWWSFRYHTVLVEGELPRHLRSKAIYVVQEDGYLEQATMVCPCGCGSVLHMNLLEDERPCWRVTQHPDGTATLFPSVWRKRGCRSHFWLRHGRVEWVRSLSGLPEQTPLSD